MEKVKSEKSKKTRDGTRKREAKTDEVTLRKTLLLVFIHGFKGGDDTFGSFPEHIRALLSHALPNINVLATTYPTYETRGDLKECVSRFREWLENKVIDLEVATGTPSPTVEPSVHAVLIGHSMGGIVAAETLIAIASERPISPPASTPLSDNKTSSSTTSKSPRSKLPSETRSSQNQKDEFSGLMFPHLQGILAFDTPFLGLAPSMVAHSIEGGHKMASNAWETYSEVASVFGWGSKAGGPTTSPNAAAKALPAPSVSSTTADAAAAPRWQSWGKYAMFAGAAGAVAAGGAAALYSQREKISAGWSWASSHLLFVGDLAKAERLKKRVQQIDTICVQRDVGAANIYTNLGKGAREGHGITDQLAGKDRTFCVVPPSTEATTTKGGDEKKTGKPASKGRPDGGLRWIKSVNEKAKDETSAHVSIFFPKDNPGFYGLGETAKGIIVSWIDQQWYESSRQKSENEGEDMAETDNLNETINRGGSDATRAEVRASFGGGPDGPIDKGWEGLDKDEIKRDEKGNGNHAGHKDGDRNGDDQDNVQMRDEDDRDMGGLDGDMEGSVIVDKSPTSSVTIDKRESKAARGEIPLPPPSKSTSTSTSTSRFARTG